MMLRNPGFTLFTPSVLGLGCPKMDPRFKGDLGQFRCADHAYEVII